MNEVCRVCGLEWPHAHFEHITHKTLEPFRVKMPVDAVFMQTVGPETRPTRIVSSRPDMYGRNCNGFLGAGVIMPDDPDHTYVSGTVQGTKDEWYGKWPINEVEFEGVASTPDGSRTYFVNERDQLVRKDGDGWGATKS